jgi:hypothetical protein
LSHEIEAFARRAWTKAEEPELMAEGERLTRQVVELRRRLARPEMRPLGRFFEASGLANVVETLRDINSTSAAQSQLERTEEHLHEISRVQKVVHVVEYALVATYMAELAHLIWPSKHEGEHAEHAIVSWPMVVAAFCGLALVEVVNWAMGNLTFTGWLYRRLCGGRGKTTGHKRA